MPDLNIATQIATASPMEIARAAERHVAQRDQSANSAIATPSATNET